MRSFATACLAIVFATLFSGMTHAAQCRAVQTVISSAASVAANNTAGGHVSIHIKGMATDVNKTQYDSEADFTKAFTNWKDLSESRIATLKLQPKDCSGNKDLIDMVLAAAVGIKVIGLCHAVGGNKLCSDYHPQLADNVCFTYHSAGGKWVLWTSYPIIGSNCLAYPGY